MALSPVRFSPRLGATLMECLCLIALLLLGLAGSGWAYHRFGWPGMILGFPLTVVGAWVVLYTTLCACAALLEGRLPRCHSGTCRGGFWDHDGDYDADFTGGAVIYVCRCLRQYRRVGRRFMEHLPDGSLRPYLAFRPFRGWAPDTEPAEGVGRPAVPAATEGHLRARHAVAPETGAAQQPDEPAHVAAQRRSAHATVNETLAALRSRERGIGSFTADALWVLDRTGPCGTLSEKSGSGEAFAFRFASERERWRVEQRGLFARSSGAREDNVWGFDKPYAQGELYPKGPRVVRVSVCDGATIGTYDSTSETVTVRRSANPRLVTRRPLRQFWLLGAGFAPQSFADLTPQDVLLSPDWDLVEGRPCRVLLTQPFEGRRPTPEDDHLLALWVCPELDDAPLQVADMTFGPGGAVCGTVALGREFIELRPRLWLPLQTVQYHLTYVGSEGPRCTQSEGMLFYRANGRPPEHGLGTDPPLGAVVQDEIASLRWVEGYVDEMCRDLHKGFPPLPEDMLQPPTKEEWLGWAED